MVLYFKRIMNIEEEPVNFYALDQPFGEFNNIFPSPFKENNIVYPSN